MTRHQAIFFSLECNSFGWFAERISSFRASEIFYSFSFFPFFSVVGGGGKGPRALRLWVLEQENEKTGWDGGGGEEGTTWDGFWGTYIHTVHKVGTYYIEVGFGATLKRQRERGKRICQRQKRNKQLVGPTWRFFSLSLSFDSSFKWVDNWCSG